MKASQEHLLDMEDAVVVAQEPDGKVKLHPVFHPAGAGAALTSWESAGS